jgi:hypothetical protein
MINVISFTLRLYFNIYKEYDCDPERKIFSYIIRKEYILCTPEHGKAAALHPQLCAHLCIHYLSMWMFQQMSFIFDTYLQLLTSYLCNPWMEIA